MKILVVGDAGSIFVKQYIEYVLVNGENEIVLLQESAQVPANYLDFYKKNNITLEPLNRKENKMLMKVPVVRSILGNKKWAKIIAKKYVEFDLIHIHGLNRNRGNIGKYLKNKTKKLAISVWGDEIFKKSDKILKKYRAYYSLANSITVSTKAMYEAFLNTYGDEYTDRISMNKFAIGEFDIIDQVKKNVQREEICKEFGIKDPQKKVVLVGHNGRSSQRHHELTKALKKLSSEHLSNITLLYTMTYGVKDEEYMKTLEKDVQELGCDYVILRDFLDEIKIAKLRIISDVLLHAQLTDAFSASIQESLYAGAVVINGNWLKYTDLPNSEERLLEYENFDDLVLKLQDVLENMSSYKEKFKDNQEVLRSISSKEVTTRAWKQALGLK